MQIGSTFFARAQAFATGALGAPPIRRKNGSTATATRSFPGALCSPRTARSRRSARPARPRRARTRARCSGRRATRAAATRARTPRGRRRRWRSRNTTRRAFPGRTYPYYLSVRKKQQRRRHLRLCAFWKRLWKRTRATSVSYTRAPRRFGSRATRRAPSFRSSLCFARTQSSVGTLRRGTRWARRSATPGASTTPWTPSKKARSARRTTEKTTDV
mmetsp:Transcript_3858/g.16387  ORF Transcript_3858/g.16387 Transcript_3858/m.16387 type:complete len:216 (+) Transcript_3858:1227-1874(+)